MGGGKSLWGQKWHSLSFRAGWVGSVFPLWIPDLFQMKLPEPNIRLDIRHLPDFGYPVKYKFRPDNAGTARDFWPNPTTIQSGEQTS